MSAHRAFIFETIEHAGQRIGANKIECSKCEGIEYLTQTGSKRNPPDFIERYFRNKGWRVGNGPRADVCPACQKKKPDLKVVSMEPAKAESPREMSREDRRIIFAKIDELYLDDKSGYQAPWTDAAVARDLGVPRSWVSTVRDELFGPEGSNPEFDAFLEQAAPIIAETKNLFRAAAKQLEEARALEGKIAELERIGRRIEKELGR